MTENTRPSQARQESDRCSFNIKAKAESEAYSVFLLFRFDEIDSRFRVYSSNWLMASVSSLYLCSAH